MTRNLLRRLLPILIFVLTSTAGSTIINVPGQEATLKSAILAAEDGDTILVASGTYTGAENCDLELGGKAIILRSIKGPTATVINCAGSAEKPHRAFYLHQGEDSRTIIDGFTIMNGYAPVDGPENQSLGGGILCNGGSSPRIIDCVFYNNTAADAGGGMYITNGSAPHVAHCSFIDNTAIDYTNVTVEYGGGVRCVNASPTFTACTFLSNLSNVGGAFSCEQADVVLDACEFNNNTADVHITFEPTAPGIGGGAHFDQSSPTLTGCVFDRNTAVYGENMGMQSPAGGGVAAFASSPTMEFCTFYGNIAEKYGDLVDGLGAGIYLEESEALIQNCIVAFNSGGESVHSWSTSVPPVIPSLRCCDLYGNELGDWVGDIAVLLGQYQNISADPIFCDSLVGNFQVHEDSPCAPDNTGCIGGVGAFGVGCVTDVSDDSGTRESTDGITLFQNHPNPFNQATVIRFALPAAADVRLTLYDVRGRRVRRLVEGHYPAGTHRVAWDGRDESGQPVASGIYFYSLESENLRRARKMIILK